jgi:hypothetical protein
MEVKEECEEGMIQNQLRCQKRQKVHRKCGGQGKVLNFGIGNDRRYRRRYFGLLNKLWLYPFKTRIKFHSNLKINSHFIASKSGSNFIQISK